LFTSPFFLFPLQVHGLLQQGLVEEATAVANALLETGADGSSVPSEAYAAFQTQAAHVCLSQMKFADAMAFFLAAGTDPVEVCMQGATVPLPFCFAFLLSRIQSPKCSGSAHKALPNIGRWWRCTACTPPAAP
jgi:hypothetical protein